MQGSQISILSIEKTARQQLFVKPQQINKVYKQRQHKMPKSFVLACTQVLAWPMGGFADKGGQKLCFLHLAIGH